MTRKILLLLLAGLLVGSTSFAQQPEKQKNIDTTLGDLGYMEDYEDLFNELDKLLDSLTAPRNFILFNIAFGSNYFNYQSKTSYLLEPVKRVTYTPSLAYYSRSGLGISASTMVMNDGSNMNPYQFSLTGSYDYLRNKKFITGIALTRIFSKDSLPFYTSPLKNELYGYFTYKKSWFKPSVALSYGWGSREEYEERQEYITSLRLALNGYTRVNTRESINDFTVISSVRHDFYWLNILRKRDYIRFTPQIVFTSGSQKFGFNQSSSTYATLPRTGANFLYNSEQVYLDDKIYFQPLSLTTYLKAGYSKGKFFIQPQLILDYYFPATEKNFTAAIVMNAGVIF